LSNRFYSTIVGPQDDYDLGTLALYVSDRLGARRHSFRLIAGGRTDDAVPEPAKGRNCATFDRARKRAYREVRRYRAVGDVDAWFERVREIVNEANVANPVLLDDKECGTITKSVANWTWAVYRRGADAAAAHRRRYEQTRDAWLGAINDRRDQALIMRAAGTTLRAIADALGVSLRTISNYLRGGSTVTSDTVQGPPCIRELVGSGELVSMLSDELGTVEQKFSPTAVSPDLIFAVSEVGEPRSVVNDHRAYGRGATAGAAATTVEDRATAHRAEQAGVVPWVLKKLRLVARKIVATIRRRLEG
jgi:hypothetical protein